MTFAELRGIPRNEQHQKVRLWVAQINGLQSIRKEAAMLSLVAVSKGVGAKFYSEDDDALTTLDRARVAAKAAYESLTNSPYVFNRLPSGEQTPRLQRELAAVVDALLSEVNTVRYSRKLKPLAS